MPDNLENACVLVSDSDVSADVRHGSRRHVDKGARELCLFSGLHMWTIIGDVERSGRVAGPSARPANHIN